MKNIYEVNYMNDKNIDERIKNICLQAENNYILNYANPPSKNDKENKNKNISLEISPLDKTITNSQDQIDIINNNIFERNQNEINHYKLNIEDTYPKNKITPAASTGATLRQRRQQRERPQGSSLTSTGSLTA